MKIKLAAYTLMEVTVAMLISAICISICYTTYGLIQSYYVRFEQKSKEANLVLDLKQVVEKDFQKAKHIIKTEDGLDILLDSMSINYSFSDTKIQREIKDLRTDTFSLAVQQLHFYFEEREANIADTVDQLRLVLMLNAKTSVPFQVNKNYSSTDLFK